MIGSGKTALVTGASSGIGLELATCLARDGYRLVLVARSEDKLQQLAGELKQKHGVESVIVPADLADPQAPQALFDRLQKDGIPVDVLVNNAGYTVWGEFIEGEVKAQTDMLQVNMVALTALTHLFLPGMKSRGQGRVLNVASTAGFIPGPMWSCYSASKAYVVSFSEAVGWELRGTGVTVTVLCPGPTETPFIQRGNAADSNLYKGRKVLGAAQVAATGYAAMQRGQSLVIAGLQNTLLVFGLRFVPRQVILFMSERAIGRAH